MQQEKKDIPAILARFRQGRLNKKERLQVFSWLSRLDFLQQKPVGQQIAARQAQSWTELEPLLSAGKKVKIISFPVWVKTAVAAVALLVLSGIWQYQKYLSEKQQGIIWSNITTGVGEVKRITLSDGSVITLNSGSKLIYPQVFSEAVREVRLNGQAFFSVVHDTAKPFRVQAGPVHVQVLGTSFDVRAYVNDPDVRIGVATGKVGVTMLVKGKPTTVFLEQGRGLAYSLNEHIHSLTKPDLTLMGDWQQSHLVYKNEPLDAIARDLERHFAIRFVFKTEKLKNKRLNLDIKSPKPETIIKALSLAGNFKYSITKGIVTFW